MHKILRKLKQIKWYYPASIIGIALIIVIGIIYLINKPQSVEATWWNDTWSYRQSIDITNGSGGELTDFQVQILNNVDLSSLSPAKLQANLADLRFTDINHRILPYWIEDNTISSANVWIKIPSIPTTGTTIYMYYGNASAINDTDSSILPRSCAGVNAYLGNGMYYLDMDGSSDTEPLQVYCDLTTNNGGWVLVASWNTAQEWTKTSSSLASVFGTTAMNTVSSNFGESEIQDFRVLASDAVTTVGASAYADWYYHYNSATAWKEVWAPSANLGGSIDNGYRSTFPRQALKPFNYSYNIKFSYQVTQTWNNLSDWSYTGADKAGCLPNYWLALTTPGNSFGVHSLAYYSGSNGSSCSTPVLDGTLGICPSNISGCVTGQDSSNNNVKIGYDDNAAQAGFGSTATTNLGQTPGVQATTKLWWFIRESASTSSSITVGSPASEENAPGPVGYWNFDEGFGTTAYDSTGYGNNGTLAGSAVWVQNGVKGRALDFNGSSDYVSVNTGSSLNITGDMTVSAWAYFDVYNDKSTIVSKWGDGGVSNFSWLLFANWWSAGRIDFLVSGNGSSYSTVSSADGIATANTWHHIVGVYDAGTSIKLYIDGVLANTNSSSIPGSLNESSMPVAIGIDYDNGSSETPFRHFDGKIDEVRIYDSALSIDEVRQLYNMNSGSFSTGRSELPSSCMDQLAQNPDSRSGVYTIDPGPGVDPFDVYCDMETDGGGWTMVASNHSSSTTIPSGTGRNAAQYELDRNGSYSALGTPDPNTDYIIGAAIDILEWDEGRVTMYGYDSTSTSYLYPDNLGDYADVKWDIPGSGSSRRDQVVGVADVTIFRNSNYASFHASADYFYIDGVRHDYIPDSVYGANSNQATVGGVGRSGTTDTGTYFGHGSSEGSYEGAYNAAGTSKNSSGYITWVRSNTTTVSPGVALDLPFENVSGSTTYDISGNGNDGAISGATHKTSANCKVGKCFDFNGTSSDFIQTTITGTYDQITFSFWGYFDDPTLDVYSRNESAFGDWTSSRVHFGTRWSVGIHWNVNSSWTEIPSTNIVYGWNHYGLVYNTDTSEKLVYINGKLALSDTTNGAMVIGDFKIGNATSLNQYYRGKLDEFKIFNRALTQREIMMEMNSGKHQPVLDLGFDEGGGDTAYDKSGFANNGDLYGTCPGDATCPTWKTAENCVNGSCLSFDGGDYINAGTVGGYTNKLTTMAWVKRTTGATSWNDIISGITGDILFSINTDKVVLGAQGNTPIQHDTYSTTLINDNIWHHVVGTYDGSTIRIYVDGILENSASKSGNYTAGNLKLGSNNAGTSEFFNGSIDGLKVYNYTLTAQEIKQEYAQSAGQFGRTNSVGDKTTPGASCADILAKNSKAGDGKYWIDTTGGSISDAFEVYCDMTTDGGGWTLIMQTSSSSAYTYSNAVWTNTSGGSTVAGNPGINQDYVSKAFYTLSGTESMLALGSQSYWNSWTHANNEARDLANQTRMTGARLSAGNCTSQTNCGAEPINLKPQGVELGTSGTTAGAWHRFGYVNDLNAWGPDIRVGFSGDNDSSDSSDTVMGLGLACNGNCATYCVTGGAHNTGSGYYFYQTWGTVPLDDAKQGWLWIRDAGTNTISTAPILDMDFDQYDSVADRYLDRSGNGYNGTPSGDPEWKTSVNCKEGRCFESDGVGDYISVATSVGSMGTNDWSINFWWKSDGTQDPYATIIGQGFTGSPSSGAWAFKVQNSTSVVSFTYYTTSIINNDSSTNANDSNWHNISGVRIGTSLYLYMDNLLIKTITLPAGFSFGTGEATYIGYNPRDSDYVNGFIDQVKVYNRALTSNELAQLYNGGAPIGWWRFDEGADNLCSDGKDVCDNSGEGNNGTEAGGLTWVTDSSNCMQGGCATFDGNDWVNIGDQSIYDFGTDQDFSLTSWFRSTGGDDRDTIINKNTHWWWDGTPRIGWGMGLDSSDRIEATIDDGITMKYTYSIGTYDDSAWHHATATFNRDGYLKLYIDGVYQSQVDISSLGTVTNGGSVVISSYLLGDQRFWHGDLDDIRIYNYVLEDKQIKEVYNQGLIHFK